MPQQNRPRLSTLGAPTFQRTQRLSADDMLALCRSFPSTCTTLTQWDPDALDSLGVEIWSDLSESWDPVFAMDEEADDLPGLPNILQYLTTIRFLLCLWDDRRKWESGSFDAMKALLDIWDDDHRAAFLAWAQAPLCP